MTIRELYEILAARMGQGFDPTTPVILYDRDYGPDEAYYAEIAEPDDWSRLEVQSFVIR